MVHFSSTSSDHLPRLLGIALGVGIAHILHPTKGKEWQTRSLLPFEILYVTSIHFLCSTLGECLGKTTVWIIHKLFPRVSFIKSKVIHSWIVLNFHILVVNYAFWVFHTKVQKSLTEQQERDPGAWWKYHMNVSGSAMYSRSWWRGMEETFSEPMSASIMASCVAFCLLLLKSILQAILGIDDLLEMYWRPHTALFLPEVDKDVKNPSKEASSSSKERRHSK